MDAAIDDMDVEGEMDTDESCEDSVDGVWCDARVLDEDTEAEVNLDLITDAVLSACSAIVAKSPLRIVGLCFGSLSTQLWFAKIAFAARFTASPFMFSGRIRPCWLCC